MQMRGNLNKDAAILAQTLNVKQDQLGKLKVFIRVSLTERKRLPALPTLKQSNQMGGVSISYKLHAIVNNVDRVNIWYSQSVARVSLCAHTLRPELSIDSSTVVQYQYPPSFGLR